MIMKVSLFMFMDTDTDTDKDMDTDYCPFEITFSEFLLCFLMFCSQIEYRNAGMRIKSLFQQR
jgi:hypothetical protein